MSARCAILIVAINARYGHCSFAGRSLLANLGPLQPGAGLIETDLDVSPFQLAADILAHRPGIVGFSVYLWNVCTVRDTLAILRQVEPELRVVLGGPEIVAENASTWRGLADDLVVGEGETAFRRLCESQAGDGEPVAGAEPRLIRAAPEPAGTLAWPYELYTDADLERRTVYVESSRGCSGHCIYCTSCATGMRLLPLDRLLPAFDRLLARGVRAFRFLDRSFNADEAHACGVLDFFLARHPARLQLHFEMTPGPLGAALRARLAAFPPGVLHLEVGVQTLNAAVARRMGRVGDPRESLETLRFLMEVRAVVHVDLIFGLPGEDENSFAAGFDTLVRTLDPPELQVNLLKRLPGTPLAQAASFAGLRFNPHPPYELLASDQLDFASVSRLQRFARIWELVHNRGRCPQAARAVWQAGADGSPFARYAALAERIQAAEGRLHAIGATRLMRHVAEFLAEACGLTPAAAAALTQGA
jgi:radical SAM superfamily enzyme YgiQ (UPF0313 family)